MPSPELPCYVSVEMVVNNFLRERLTAVPAIRLYLDQIQDS